MRSINVFYALSLAELALSLGACSHAPAPAPAPPGGAAQAPAAAYRYVKLEDLSQRELDGPSPGAEVGAVGLDRDGDGEVDHWASAVVEADLRGAGNAHRDASTLLGVEGMTCEGERYAALGGGAVVVSFRDAAGEEITFGSGAMILVWEVGPTCCPARTSTRDDATRVLVSASKEPGSFEEVGVVGNGSNATQVR